MSLPITSGFRNFLIQKYQATPEQDDAYYRAFTVGLIKDQKIEVSEIMKFSEAELTETIMGGPSLDEILGAAGGDGASLGGGSGRVKASSEMYSATKSVAKHHRTGQPVMNERGRECQTTSELEIAKSGVMFKFWAGRSGLQAPLSPHEKGLLGEIFEKDTWCGNIDRNWETGVPGMRVKALLSDSLSGGVEVNPEWFDDLLIQFPLLHGELFPFVTLRQVPRGSSVEAASLGNPSVSWGNEGTSISLFDTDSLVSPIDTTIHDVATAVEVGRDFLADSAADVGAALLQNIGQRMLSEFDNVVANGNGTDRPEGIFTASGLTSVSSAGGAGTAPQIDDYEALIFAVGKQYRRNPSMNMAFIANDTSYSRARGIAVGGGDARRVLGLDHKSYSVLQYDYRIENNVGNATIAFGALSTYRMYRRAGTETRFISEDKELARKNQVMLIVRARMGGKITDGSAWSKIADALA